MPELLTQRWDEVGGVVWVVRFDEVVVGIGHLLWCVYDGHFIYTMTIINGKKEERKVDKKQSYMVSIRRGEMNFGRDNDMLAS